MINLLNGDNKRGVVVFTAKEWRMLHHYIMSLDVDARCIKNQIEIFDITAKAEDRKTELRFMKQHAKNMRGYLDKIYDILR